MRIVAAETNKARCAISGLDEAQLAKVLASPQSVERDLEREYQRLRTFDADQRWRPEYLRKFEAIFKNLFQVWGCDFSKGEDRPAVFP